MIKLTETEAWKEQVFINEHWQGSAHQNMKLLSASAIGSFGEKIAKELLELQKYKVEKRKNSDHDFVVDGKKVELKTASAVIGKNGKRNYVINQIRPASDYEVLLMLLIDPNGYRLYYGLKEDYSEENPEIGLKHQHGGSKAKGNTLILNVVEEPPKATKLLEVNYAIRKL